MITLFHIGILKSAYFICMSFTLQAFFLFRCYKNLVMFLFDSHLNAYGYINSNFLKVNINGIYAREIQYTFKFENFYAFCAFACQWHLSLGLSMS